MKYQFEKENEKEYLASTHYIDWQNPLIQQKATALFADCQTEREKIKVAFEFVRDQIPHSGDIASRKITRTASEALQEGEGICYVKAMLLAALLRSQGIPAGLCYQRLAREKDFIIHALNAVYLSDLQKWVRVDARGNLPGKEAVFQVDAPEREQLVFVVRPAQGEIDYPVIFAEPPVVTTKVLEETEDCQELLQKKLPQQL